MKISETISSYMIADCKFDVALILEKKNNGLTWVRLQTDWVKNTENGIGLNCYRQITPLLIQKYGKPATKEGDEPKKGWELELEWQGITARLKKYTWRVDQQL